MSIAIGIDPLQYIIEEKIITDDVEIRQPIAAFVHFDDAVDFLQKYADKFGSHVMRNQLWFKYPVFFTDDRVYAIRKIPTVIKNKDIYNWVK